MLLGLAAVLGILLAAGGGICVPAGLLIRRAGRARAFAVPLTTHGLEGQQAPWPASER
ncbi:hypothetical protein [Streptomyces sp. LN549]|uniref:hypothetical protein n=1 Tax=Streptomyces sp. LN549 TaxID=3112979 RepID=UPI003722C357